MNSSGSGHDSFWQVVETTPKTVVARKLEYKVVSRNIKRQSLEIVPVKDKFLPPEMEKKYIGGYMKGESKFRETDVNTVRLRIADDGRIGPIMRLDWWSLWEGNKLNQYSS